MEEQKDLTMLNKPVSRKPNGLLIVLLLLFIACICIGSFLLGKSFYNDKQGEPTNENTKTEQKKETKKEEPTKEPAPREQSLSDQIIDAADEKLIEKGLLKPSMIEYRSTIVKKAGYFQDKPNEIYYTLTGQFKCKESSNPANETTCLYQPQVGEPDAEGKYNYIISFTLEIKDGKYIVGEFTDLWPNENFVEINEIVE